MHVLMRSFMEGLGAKRREPHSSSAPSTLPAGAASTDRSFTHEEFHQLAEIMGGVTHVRSEKPAESGANG